MKTTASLMTLLACAGSLTFACSADDSADSASGGRSTKTAGEAESGGGLSGSDSSLAAEGAEGEGPTEPGDGAAGAGGMGSDVPARIPPPKPRQVPPGELTAGIFDDNLSFDFFQSYRQLMLDTQDSGLPSFELSDHESAWQRSKTDAAAHKDLDISLVIDTTGSMGDELAYLQNEFSTLTATIKERFPQATQNWSLVVYRDEGDEYLAQSTPFTSDLDQFRTTLKEQNYGGGGDFPEAPDAGLAAANQLKWRTGDDVARLLFWVADAPHHSEKASALRREIVSAQEQDIHIYPVASSGVDEFTEYTMRASAQLTLGRYLFLTNDSGLGGDHKEPTVPCSYVHTLKDAILRSVDVEMTGEHLPPEPESIIRLNGNMNELGACFYGEGDEAWPF